MTQRKAEIQVDWKELILVTEQANILLTGCK